MKRVFLFLITNLAIVFILSITLRLLGVDRILNESGYGLDYNALLVLSLVMGFGGSFISLFISKWTAKNMTGAQVITNPSSPVEHWLLATVERLAKASGIGMPEVAIYDAADINAFATGWNRNASLIAVSTGLLNNMSQDEVEGVLAHEISHVANGDMVTLTLIQGVVNTFVIFFSRIVGFIVDKVIFKTERGNGPAFFITSLVAQLVLGVLASMIVMWFSRHREFRADAGSATLAGRGKMIAALERLKQMHEPAKLPEQMAAFGISGGDSGSFMGLFLTHPPLEKRIEALKSRI